MVTLRLAITAAGDINLSLFGEEMSVQFFPCNDSYPWSMKNGILGFLSLITAGTKYACGTFSSSNIRY